MPATPATHATHVLPRASRLTLVLCCILLLFAVGLQLRNGWMLGQSSLVDDDPPAHFVSGVMVYDYLRQGIGTSPMAFAESYYVRYPKVAIGHWPPAYYAVQAVWYSIFGVHIFSARLLSALIVLVLAVMIGRVVRRTHGIAIAVASAALFLTSPEVLEYTWAAMSDLMTALWIWMMLLATVPLLNVRATPQSKSPLTQTLSPRERASIFSEGASPSRPPTQTSATQTSATQTFAMRTFATQIFAMRTFAPTRWAVVGVVARVVIPGVLAILTKGTAWAIAPWLVIAPLFARRLRAFRGAWCWVAAVAIVVLGAPFYLMMRASGTSYPVDAAALATAGTGDGVGLMVRFAFLRPLRYMAPTVVLLIAFAGALDAIHARWRRGGSPSEDQSALTLDLIAAAWIAAQIAFFFLLPLSEDARAWLASVPPIILLFARGLSRIQSLVQRSAPTYPIAAALTVPVVLAIAMLTADFRFKRVNPVDGYRAAAAAIPYPAEGTLSLISSDAAGEGAFIVERLIADPARAGVVLRGDQTIAAANWSGSVEQVAIGTPQSVRDRLVELQVKYVVLDSSTRTTTDARKLLKRSVEEDPATFRPIGRFPVTDRVGRRRGELAVYENPAAVRPREIRVQLGLDRGRRTLVYRWP